jgi:hypothetical protein
VPNQIFLNFILKYPFQKILCVFSMIRIIICFVFCCVYTNLLFSQWSGNGTYSAPFEGTVPSTQTWYPDSYPDQTIYAKNLTIPSGVVLTMAPGMYSGGLIQFTPNRTLNIQTGGEVVIGPQTAISVYRIVNNGRLKLESDANEAGTSSLIVDLAEGTGICESEVFLSGGTTLEDEYRWHYLSVPMDNISVSIFNTLDFAQYVESLVVGQDSGVGWVAWDGYHYSTGNILPGFSFNTLELGKGYNYYSATGSKIIISGSLLAQNFIEINLTCVAGSSNVRGLNLIGNPFPSCLDWDEMVRSGGVPGSVNNAIYFTNNGTIASYVGGIGSNGGTGIIPPLQGFFVKANLPESIIFPFSARVHDFFQMRYKKGSYENYDKNSDTIAFVRLKLLNLEDSTDLVVRFNDKATIGVDKDYDAYTFNKTSGTVNIWTTSASVNYSINGLPFPETILDLPVGISARKAGSYQLLLSEFKKLTNYSVFLKDQHLNTTTELGNGGILNLNIPEGITEGRFLLSFRKIATEISGSEDFGSRFRIYFSDGILNILSLSDNNDNSTGSVMIFDINGRIILQRNGVNWTSSGETKQFSLDSYRPGIYFVEIKAGNTKVVEKVLLF